MNEITLNNEQSQIFRQLSQQGTQIRETSPLNQQSEYPHKLTEPEIKIIQPQHTFKKKLDLFNRNSNQTSKTDLQTSTSIKNYYSNQEHIDKIAQEYKTDLKMNQITEEDNQNNSIISNKNQTLQKPQINLRRKSLIDRLKNGITTGIVQGVANVINNSHYRRDSISKTDTNTQQLQKQQEQQNNFSVQDLKLLQKTIENEQIILDQELKEFTDINYCTLYQNKQQENGNNSERFSRWNKAKGNLRVISRIKRLGNDMKTFGTSLNLLKIDVKDLDKLQISLNDEDIGIDDQRKLINSKKYIIYPDSVFIQIWSVVLIFLLLYSAYITPIKVAFIDDISYGWLLIENFVNALFFMDMIITIRSAYFTSDGQLIDDPKHILLHYIKFWFFLDFLAIFPFDQISDQYDAEGSNVKNIAKIAKLPRLYRLLSIIRIMKMIKRVNKDNFLTHIQDFLQLNPSTVRLIVFFISITVCTHIMGCIWYYSAKLQSFGPDTWVSKFGMNDQTDYELYLACIYWAISTIATVGLGDIHANNDLEKILSIIWMLLGAGFYSFTIGSLSGVFANLDTRKAHLEVKISVLEEFAKETKLSKDLKLKLKKSLEYNSYKSIFSQNDRDEFLQELPLDLKSEIASSMYRGLTQNFPFFRNLDKGIVANIVLLLQPLKVNQGEFIYRIGEYPNTVYFLVSGKVNFVVGSNRLVYKSFVSSSYFGEIEIFQNTERQSTVRAEIDSELLYITRQKFMRVLKEYPEFFNQLKEVAKEREARNIEALRKIQRLLPLSRKSKFWQKKRKHSLYDKRRLNRFQNQKNNNVLLMDSNFSEEQLNQQKQSKSLGRILNKLRFATKKLGINQKKSESPSHMEDQENNEIPEESDVSINAKLQQQPNTFSNRKQLSFQNNLLNNQTPEEQYNSLSSQSSQEKEEIRQKKQKNIENTNQIKEQNNQKNQKINQNINIQQNQQNISISNNYLILNSNDKLKDIQESQYTIEQQQQQQQQQQGQSNYKILISKDDQLEPKINSGIEPTIQSSSKFSTYNEQIQIDILYKEAQECQQKIQRFNDRINTINNNLDKIFKIVQNSQKIQQGQTSKLNQQADESTFTNKDDYTLKLMLPPSDKLKLLKESIVLRQDNGDESSFEDNSNLYFEDIQ